MKKFVCFSGNDLWSLDEKYTALDEKEFTSRFDARVFIPLPHDSDEYFLVDLDEYAGKIPLEGYLHDLRTLIADGDLDDELTALCSAARGYLEWYRNSRYCGKCGQKTEFDFSEKAAVCPGCRNMYYPRISPCVIVLVHDGSRLLLANHVRFHSRRLYALLAGYVEPGENLEHAIRREVLEETNIKVTDICYRMSQNWPFPQQIMAGFFARYESGIIRIQKDEISDAGWFDISALPVIPGPCTVAGKLIRLYIREFKEGNADNS
ncbi:MAG: NAD(+) diphosphatase [Spirochaetales bacterium]|nr:NAD(+) diphosphatase [Spirochaetales bacterium]